MQPAADDGPGLVALGDTDRAHSRLFFGDVHIVTDEVRGVSAKPQRGGQPRVVVVGLRDVTVLALAGLLAANRVRRVRSECKAGEARRGHGGLLVNGDVPPAVGDGHADGIRGPEGRDLVALTDAADPHHVVIGPQ